MLLFLVAASSNAVENNMSKLIVQGEGKASAAPDKATIVLGVQTRDASAAIAAEENARQMNETITALLAAGIAEASDETHLGQRRDGEPEDGATSGPKK